MIFILIGVIGLLVGGPLGALAAIVIYAGIVGLLALINSF